MAAVHAMPYPSIPYWLGTDDEDEGRKPLGMLKFYHSRCSQGE